MHGSLLKGLDVLKDQNENVSFGSCAKLLGCQYPCVISILDVATTIAPVRILTHTMTRATTSLYLIINTSRCPIYISGIPSARHEICLSQNVEARIRELISEVAHLGKKVWIFERFSLLSTSFVNNIATEARTTSVRIKDEELREESKKYSLLIFIGNNVTDPRIPSLSTAPCIIIQVVNSMRMRWEMERLRSRTIDFFAEEAVSCIRTRPDGQ